MNFPFYIARRYLISKKSHNIINIISAISVTGVCIGTMALIIVLSVFNGFEKLVLSLFSSFNPDVRIIAARGKTFDIRSLPVEEIRKIPGVVHLSEVIEEDALVRYRDKQTIVTLKGVEKTFPQMTGIDTMMIEGKFLLEDSAMNFGVPGYGIASTLGVNLQDYQNPLVIYVPRRDGSFSTSLDNAF
ncbi:MAG TPA: ABC transporter permease, partial [Bacteroidales bacterium]|nr:ABC transporter permease [Bacteroidales bacterium]